MNELTYEQKLAALKAISDVCLRMRDPGNWYVDARERECREGSALVGKYGNGATPQEAVNDDWEQISNHPKVVIGGERTVRWNGFMWQDVK